jgi:hypothetical protein
MPQKPDRHREYMKAWRSKAREPSRPKEIGASGVLGASARSPSNPHSAVTAIDPEDVREYFEERAAVLEYDHGLPRFQAEVEAVRRTAERYGFEATRALT